MSSDGDIVLIDEDEKYNETDPAYQVADGTNRIANMHEKLRKNDAARLKREAADRAKKVDAMEDLKFDLTEETVRLLLARRKRKEKTFTDYIVK